MECSDVLKSMSGKGFVLFWTAIQLLYKIFAEQNE